MKEKLTATQKMTLLMHGISAAAHLCGCTRKVEKLLCMRNGNLTLFEQMK